MGLLTARVASSHAIESLQCSPCPPFLSLQSLASRHQGKLEWVPLVTMAARFFRWGRPQLLELDLDPGLVWLLAVTITIFFQLKRWIHQSVDSTSALAESGNGVLARLVPFVDMLISAMKMNEM